MKIALIGYGKMGRMIEETALQRGHEVTLKIDADNLSDFTKEKIAQADVAIEFTGPGSAYENIKKCIEFDIPVISGSTGWNNRMKEIEQECVNRNGSFLYASNFSIGVNIFFQLNQLLAKLMSQHPEYSINIKETHHTQKKDAPSGTAVTLAEQIIQYIPAKKAWENCATADSEKIPIISERIDPAPGTHEINYSSQIDDVTIVHTAHNRKGFALGAVLAAEFIHDKKGIFSMQDVLNLPALF